LLGVTEQLIGIEWLNAPPFRYAGNIGPVELSAELRQDLARVGDALGAGCGLLGLFGIDFILNDGRPWVVEVNPRYTASIEVLERATGLLALAHHHRAFGPGAVAFKRNIRTGCVGKAIAYALRRLVMPKTSADLFDLDSFADIPSAGEVIEPGWPVLTCVVEAATRDECFAGLQRLAMHTRAIIDSCDAAN
jgi:predicted ATP-grasp superfamily ATP-dependent carboligase